MSKIIEFHTRSLQKGANILANAVKGTLGPQGRNVILSRQFNAPHITKDGVSVASSIKLEDPNENLGAQLLQEIANKTLEVSGDGTTTSIVLAQTILNEGLRLIAEGTNPVKLKKGIELATVEAIQSIKSQSLLLQSDSILNVATISANNDFTIGKLIADAVNLVGEEGLITVEESRSTETYIEVTEGLKIDKGYISPYFVTDPNKMVVEYQNALILITDEKITATTQILKYLEACVKEQRALIIICEDLVDEALSTLVVNRMKGIKVAAIKAPAHGDHKKELLQDIATITGGLYITQDKGLSLESSQLSSLGQSDVKIFKDSTTLINGKGKKEDILIRVSQIKEQAKHAELQFDQDRLTKRAQKLSGGAAVLYVGATTETELKEKADRIDDALCATKAAIAEGIVPGGGTAFIKAIASISSSKDKDIQSGIDLIKKALEAPLRQILQNAGLEEDPIISKVKKGKQFNAKSEQYEDLLVSGVIDPTKVVRVALENASSVCALFLTTSCVVAEKYIETPMNFN
jgi:chaperonin GroEL